MLAQQRVQNPSNLNMPATYPHHVTHRDELGVVAPVLRSSSVPLGGVLPVQVETVKVVLPEELDGALDEGATPGRVFHQLGEASRPLVPASDGDQRLQVAVVRLQRGELAVPTCQEQIKERLV